MPARGNKMDQWLVVATVLPGIHIGWSTQRDAGKRVRNQKYKHRDVDPCGPEFWQLGGDGRRHNDKGCGQAGLDNQSEFSIWDSLEIPDCF